MRQCLRTIGRCWLFRKMPPALIDQGDHVLDANDDLLAFVEHDQKDALRVQHLFESSESAIPQVVAGLEQLISPERPPFAEGSTLTLDGLLGYFSHGL